MKVVDVVIRTKGLVRYDEVNESLSTRSFGHTCITVERPHGRDGLSYSQITDYKKGLYPTFRRSPSTLVKVHVVLVSTPFTTYLSGVHISSVTGINTDNLRMRYGQQDSSQSSDTSAVRNVLRFGIHIMLR